MNRPELVVRWILPAALLTLTVISHAQTVLYVDHSATGASTGDSWTDAFTTATAALTEAASGDEIWVASGTYHEAISLSEGVALYGGFLGMEHDRDQREWKSNPTILDTTGLGVRVVTVQGAQGTTISGFRLTGGKTDGNGGGVYYEYVRSATLSDCIITNNTADSGGGIHCFYSHPTIVSCEIINNSNNHSGGIVCSKSNPTISGTQVEGNYGPGISCSDSKPEILHSTITRNTHEGISLYSSSATISDCSITKNNDSGIYCRSSSPNITNSLIARNSAPTPIS